MTSMCPKKREEAAPRLWVLARLWDELSSGGSLPQMAEFFARDARSTSGILPFALMARMGPGEEAVRPAFVGTELGHRLGLQASASDLRQAGDGRLLSLLDLLTLAAEARRPYLAAGRIGLADGLAETVQVAVFPLEERAKDLALLACFEFLEVAGGTGVAPTDLAIDTVTSL